MEIKLKKMSTIPLVMVFGILFLTGCQSNAPLITPPAMF